jgi:hypothetical protein
MGMDIFIPGFGTCTHLVSATGFRAQITLPLFIANGVTGVRDMGSELQTVQD